ncbi:MAG: polysaccharide export protein [Pedosphaera sp.]|nr:polysaccharide export protein [Pedosphaera sp.]
MIFKNWIAGLGLLLAALAWSGCETTNSPPKEVACSSDELQAGDSVTVTFADLPSDKGLPEHRERVKDDGTLNLPLIGSVKAAGKKIGDLQKEIQGLYVPRYYTRLTVTIKTEDRFYSVGGEVKAPGRQVYLGSTTLLKAIQSCADFTDFANQRKVQVIRANGDRQVIDAKKARENPKKFDVPICPGDSIHVPKSL